MKILLLNQTFYPDVASSAQHLKDFALRLAERGHAVTVVASQRGYDDPSQRFVARETWRGVRILRVRSTGFGKRTKWTRSADFASFLGFCCWRLLMLPRHDVVVALTSPPLISFIGAWLAILKRSRFFYWVMDLNPDEAIVAGWLRESSLTARVLQRMSRFSLRRADKVIVLDRFMQARIAAKGVAPGRIAVIPPWSHDDAVRYDPEGRRRFRETHGLDGKFVVMYSGNHSPCHPLTSLLEAARRLASEPRVVFCFVGGGSEFAKVRRFAEAGGLTNVICLPYQPLAGLAGSLSAADLHVVVMGDPFVGTIHPCKIYNVLSIESPVLYIGPEPSHVSEILEDLRDSPLCGRAEHGDVDAVVRIIGEVSRLGRRGEPELFAGVAARFHKETLLPRLVEELEKDAGNEPAEGHRGGIEARGTVS